ncbi:hypothetical protein PEL8287_01131 [Roseovarius litorisediminis]|uniref:VPLPA-CTERM protein sorting domain protein n=1 Tax=Roseovarius litorisediminis TaxID=1312363 RepID=A0A1Y5RSV9_9RHOB|nr:VPLPA-CTERM sorting domain-containing protein [Roseovarius litorisediminis]SLN24640.1 hypothetical protein PEL8287_01131 [Roseovarius litorisediminis]
MTFKYSGAAGCALFVFGAMANAATTTETFSNSYSTSQSLFGGASSSAFDFSATVGGVINFSAGANSGTVNSLSGSSHALTYDDVLTLSEAARAGFSHEVTNLRSGFSTSYGATANANVTLLGAQFDIIDEGASVSTSRTNVSVGFGQTIEDTGRDGLVGKAVEAFGISPSISATVNLEQRSRQTIGTVTGLIEARNTSTGTVVRRSYNINSSSADLFELDLSEQGTWELFALSMDMFGTFDADFGTSATGTVGAFIGFGCGDVSTDSDNGTFCVADFGTSVTSPAAYVKNGTPFGLRYNSTYGSRRIGSLTVISDPVVGGAVPLPAGGLLLISGLGIFTVARRRRAQV